MTGYLDGRCLFPTSTHTTSAETSMLSLIGSRLIKFMFQKIICNVKDSDMSSTCLSRRSDIMMMTVARNQLVSSLLYLHLWLKFDRYRQTRNQKKKKTLRNKITLHFNGCNQNFSQIVEKRSMVSSPIFHIILVLAIRCHTLIVGFVVKLRQIEFI